MVFHSSDLELHPASERYFAFGAPEKFHLDRSSRMSFPPVILGLRNGESIGKRTPAYIHTWHLTDKTGSRGVIWCCSTSYTGSS